MAKIVLHQWEMSPFCNKTRRCLKHKKLYPLDPEALARARLWEDWAAGSLYFYEIYFRMLDPVALERALDLICEGRPRWERSVLKLVFQRRYPKKLKQQGLARSSRGEVERQFFALLDAVEQLLERRSWLAGDAVSIADFSVAAQIDELVRTSDLAPQVQARSRIKNRLARC